MHSWRALFHMWVLQARFSDGQEWQMWFVIRKGNVRSLNWRTKLSLPTSNFSRGLMYNITAYRTCHTRRYRLLVCSVIFMWYVRETKRKDRLVEDLQRWICEMHEDIATANITNIPVWKLEPSSSPPMPIYKSPSHKLIVPSGERYVSYLMALFPDVCKQDKSFMDVRSVGGCYMMPLWLPAHVWK